MKTRRFVTEFRQLYDRYFAAAPDGIIAKIRQLMTNPDQSYFSNDPLAKPIVGSGKWYPFLYVPLFMILFAVIGLFVCGARMDFLHTPSTRDFLGSLDDPTEWIVNFILNPTLVAYYFLVPALIENVFTSLRRNGVVNEHGRHDFDLYLTWFKHDFNAFGWFNVAYVVAVIVTIAETSFLLADSGFSPPQGWHYARTPYLFFGFPTLLIFWYCFAYTAIRLVIFHLSLRHFYGQLSLNFQPLHEDGYGGLGPIVDLTKTYVGWLGPMVSGALIAAMRANQQQQPWPPLVALLIAVVVLLLILGLLVPLLSTQAYLDRKKREAIHSVNLAYERTKDEMASEGNAGAVKILKLDKLYLARTDLNNAYPQGPINVQALFMALVLNLALPLFIAFLATRFT